MARSTSLLIRSLLFNALFYANLVIQMVVALPTFVMPRRYLLAIVRSYARTSIWLLRVVCNVRVEYRGLGTFRAAPASSPPSTSRRGRPSRFCGSSRSGLHSQARVDVDFVVRLVHLEGGHHAGRSRRRMARCRAWRARRRRGARARQCYFSRGYAKAARRQAGLQDRHCLYLRRGRCRCVPVALNSGLFWPRRSLRRVPGTILVEASSQSRRDLTGDSCREVGKRTEEATARLVAEGRREIAISEAAQNPQDDGTTAGSAS